ncbi:hypothetical protein LCGC14_2755060 [marine sediment metagenome]|uniref:Uncharacterized protein n=1 Tax=marine sediment metagenome TaxID=412755 RepID=A0A0F8Z0S8_9ZZZZ
MTDLSLARGLCLPLVGKLRTAGLLEGRNTDTMTVAADLAEHIP